ncbi:RICIN domain-containing protein [Kitasatospora sp. NPDC052868]|uniref:RICIN domain-containing protein n=1 Tax=Kitasatospora sp. NPDC052868 TaxID=3364060 RepID=UPI0037C6E466
MPPHHRPAARRRSRHRLGAALVAAATLTLGGLAAPPAGATTAEAAAHVTVRLDPSYQQQPFQGWGTSLAWFANVTGGWPDSKRNQLADALYGADGLGFTVARYNIGGGDSPETKPYMRPGAAVPGYWNRPARFGPPASGTAGWTEPANWWNPDDPDHWNPQADANQRWWLTAAKARGADTFEAFSNSAPYFMTDSGLVSGSATSPWQDNLRSDQYDRFATYLAGSLKLAQAGTGVTFGSVEPVNEPTSTGWSAGNGQEGSSWSPASQAHIVDSLHTALAKAGLGTPIAAMDEGTPGGMSQDWAAYPATTRAAVARLNTHTYNDSGRGAARDAAKGSDKPLWMSEVDTGGYVPQSFTDMTPALAFAHRITDDVRELEPRAWVMWQAIEDYTNMTPAHENSNWGLIQVAMDSTDPANEPIRRNKKYWAMANYSRFIQPGARAIGTDSTDTLAALRPGGAGAVAVYTNSTGAARTVTLDLAGFRNVDPSVPAQQYTTDATRNVERGADLTATAAKTLTATVGPGSVTTFVLPGVTGVDPAAATTPAGAVRQLVNDNSGLALAADAATMTKPVQRTPNPADAAQQWSFTAVDGGWDSTAVYRVTNAGNGKALTTASGALGLAPPDGSTEQQWAVSTAGDGHATLVNKAAGLLLDVSGAATNDGAPVGVWTPTNGTNQSWAVRGAAPDTWASLRVRRSGMCADVLSGSWAPAAPVGQYPCGGGANQQWSLRPSSPGHVTVVVRHSGQCLDVAGASTADDAPIVQYPCGGGTNQEWSVRGTGSGYVTLVARHSGECLAVMGGSTTAQARLVQSPCDASTGQQFLVG